MANLMPNDPLEIMKREGTRQEMTDTYSKRNV